ncbi:MAG TPA: hypothetical protein VF746_24405 [Longimicrobium sp.]|jgi:type II secretory pathway pseudopilin PulG
MNPPIPRRPDAGFTLYELVAAILLVGLAVHPLITTLSADTRIATDRRQRLDAERLLRNEAALLAAADPAAVPPTRTYRADRSGRAAAAGVFEVTARRTVRCGVGNAPRDNASAPPVAGCAAGGVVADYTVSVTYPREAGAGETGTLTHTFSVAASAPHGAGIGAVP